MNHVLRLSLLWPHRFHHCIYPEHNIMYNRLQQFDGLVQYRSMHIASFLKTFLKKPSWNQYLRRKLSCVPLAVSNSSRVEHSYFVSTFFLIQKPCILFPAHFLFLARNRAWPYHSCFIQPNNKETERDRYIPSILVIGGTRKNLIAFLEKYSHTPFYIFIHPRPAALNLFSQWKGSQCGARVAKAEKKMAQYKKEAIKSAQL